MTAQNTTVKVDVRGNAKAGRNGEARKGNSQPKEPQKKFRYTPISSILDALNPFRTEEEDTREIFCRLPNGELRQIRAIVSNVNSKGFVTIQTVPHANDGNKAMTFPLKQSTEIKIEVK